MTRPSKYVVGFYMIVGFVVIVLFGRYLLNKFTVEANSELRYVAIKKGEDERWGIMDITTGKVVVDNEWIGTPMLMGEDLVKVRTKDGSDIIYKIADKPIKVGDEYEDVGDFNDGLINVVKKGRYPTFIDKNGKEILSLRKIDDKLVDKVGSFHDGLACFMDEDLKWGYIDKKGVSVVKAKFDNITDFHEGYARVSKKGGDGSNTLSLINASGVEVLKLDGAALYSTVSDGLMAYSDDNGKTYGFIDLKGEKIIKPSKDFKQVTGFIHGMAAFYDGDRWGIINRKGEIIVRAKYQFAFPSNGLIIVNDNGKFGYIDYSGKEIVKPQYEDAYPFIANNTFVKDGSKFILINKKGKEVCKEGFKEVRIDYDQIMRWFQDVGDPDHNTVTSRYFDIANYVDKIFPKISYQEVNGLTVNSTLKNVMNKCGIAEDYLTQTNNDYMRNHNNKYGNLAENNNVLVWKLKGDCYAPNQEVRFIFDQNIREPIYEGFGVGYFNNNIKEYRINYNAKVYGVVYRMSFYKIKADGKYQDIYGALQAKLSCTTYMGGTNDGSTTIYNDDLGLVGAVLRRVANDEFVVGVKLNKNPDQFLYNTFISDIERIL